MESSFKQGSTDANGGLNSAKSGLFGTKAPQVTDEQQTMFRIRPGSKPIVNKEGGQPSSRVPTIYGMPKLKGKTLPKVSPTSIFIVAVGQSASADDGC